MFTLVCRICSFQGTPWRVGLKNKWSQALGKLRLWRNLAKVFSIQDLTPLLAEGMTKNTNVCFVQVLHANPMDQAFCLSPCRHRCHYWKLKHLPAWLSGSLELKSFLTSSSADPREVILTWCLCTQPSISELDSLKPWNTMAILLRPVWSLIIINWTTDEIWRDLSSHSHQSQPLKRALNINPMLCLFIHQKFFWVQISFWT